MNKNFTQVPNAVLEQTYKSNLNGSQIRILLFVLRYTSGFHREYHDFSIKYVSKGTKLSDRQVQRELSNLINRNMIIVRKDESGKAPRILGINMNTSEWINVEKQESAENKGKTTTGQLFAADYYGDDII